MTKEMIGLALGVISEKLTPEHITKVNRALKHVQQKHYAKVRKQRSKRK
jgi:hypothetical protein